MLQHPERSTKQTVDTLIGLKNNMDTIPYFDIEVDTDIANVETDCIKILEKVRPNWKREELKLKTLTEGFANPMMLCHLKHDEGIEAGIILRMHGKGIYSKLKEFTGLQVGSATGVGPHILARFKNGICLNYLKGRTLSFKELQDQNIMRLLCKALARLHAMDLYQLKLVDYDGKPCMADEKSRFEAIDKLLPNIKPYDSIKIEEQRNRIKQECPPLEDLIHVYKHWREEIEKLQFPTVFCHNDIHHRNMIYNEETDALHFIDFEVFGKNYQSAEIARYLQIKDFYVPIGMASADDEDMDIEKFTEFMKTYLSEYYLITKGDGVVSDLDLRRAVLESQIINKFMNLPYLLVSLYSMHNPVVKADTYEFVLIANKNYSSYKTELPNHIEEYKKIRKLLEGQS